MGRFSHHRMFNSAGIGHRICPIQPELPANNSVKPGVFSFSGFVLCIEHQNWISSNYYDLRWIFWKPTRSVASEFFQGANPVEKMRNYDKQLYLFLGKALENGICLISIESDIVRKPQFQIYVSGWNIAERGSTNILSTSKELCLHLRISLFHFVPLVYLLFLDSLAKVSYSYRTDFFSWNTREPTVYGSIHTF
jgi:hypothetical protein